MISEWESGRAGEQEVSTFLNLVRRHDAGPAMRRLIIDRLVLIPHLPFIRVEAPLGFAPRMAVLFVASLINPEADAFHCRSGEWTASADKQHTTSSTWVLALSTRWMLV